MQYITATYLLERLPKSCMILNKPNSIRDCPEKLFVLDFFDLMPPTLISKQKSNIIKVVNLKKLLLNHYMEMEDQMFFTLMKKILI